MKNSQKGATGIITVLILLVISVGGYMYYKSSSSSPASNAPVCEDQGCFISNFKTCTPSIFEMEAGGSGVRYEIVGKGVAGCDMTFTYTKINMSNWQNKPMTCDFDNKTSLENAVKKVFEGIANKSVVCEGPLYDAMTGN